MWWNVEDVQVAEEERAEILRKAAESRKLGQVNDGPLVTRQQKKCRSNVVFFFNCVTLAFFLLWIDSEQQKIGSGETHSPL